LTGNALLAQVYFIPDSNNTKMTPAKTNVMRIVCPKCKATTHKEQDDNEENKKYDMHSQDRTTVRSKRAKTNTEQTQNNSDKKVQKHQHRLK
jgi:DNA-directed RNA polymerase subunit M/transcription elongation factor TFIIS